jgi:hypothetical protein
MKVVRSFKAGRESSGLIEGWGLLEICQIRALLSLFNPRSTSIHLCHNGGSFEWGKQAEARKPERALALSVFSLGQERERRESIDWESNISYTRPDTPFFFLFFDWPIRSPLNQLRHFWAVPLTPLSLKVLYGFRVGNRAVAYSALYHNSFILGHSCSLTLMAWDICRRRESYIWARGQTNPIHPGLIRRDLVELIDPLLYALLRRSFFPTWTRLLWLLLWYSGNILLWWRVGSENTNAAENDRMNRNPLNLCWKTTEKERLRVLQVVDLSLAC